MTKPRLYKDKVKTLWFNVPILIEINNKHLTTQRQRKEHKDKHTQGNKHNGVTDKHTQGHGHSIFPPPPIWYQVLGSDVFAPPRGQREQGRIVLSHSNLLAKEPWPGTGSNKHVSVFWINTSGDPEVTPVTAADETDLALIKAAKQAAS